ncbi:MAG: hypothetical protein WC730_02210 [Patescibacteria group bacterium]
MRNVSTNEILDQMNSRFEQVDKKFYEILDQMNSRFDKVDQRFEQVDQRFERIDQRFEQVDKRFEHSDQRFEQVDENFHEILEAVHEFSSQVDERFKRIETTMVTKSYLDDKLADLRGDLVGLARKGNEKFSTLVKTLRKKDFLSAPETSNILAMEPFPSSGK